MPWSGESSSCGALLSRLPEWKPTQPRFFWGNDVFDSLLRLTLKVKDGPDA